MSSGSRIATAAKGPALPRQPAAGVEAPGQEPGEAAEPAAAQALPLPGARQLRHLAALGALVALFESSELLGGRGVIAVAVLVAAIVVVGLALFLRAAAATRLAAGEELSWYAPIHYLLPVLAVAAAAGFAFVVRDWRPAVLAQLLMGAAVFASSYVTLQRFLGRSRPGHDFLHDAAVVVMLLGAFLAIYVGLSGLITRLVLVLVVTFLAAYESFLPVAKGDAEAIFYSQSVAVVTTAIAFALTYTGILPAAQVAVILMLVWYVERGVIVHFVAGDLTRSVLREYALLGLLALALIVNALLNR